MNRLPGRAGSRHASARSAAASACCPASGGCACRCPGRASRTATPGRWPRATASCCSTAATTTTARSATSSGRWRWSTSSSSTCGCSSAPTRTPTTTARRRRSSTRTGCELWMHPNHEHMTRVGDRPRGVAAAPPGGRPPVRRAGRAARALRRAAQGREHRRRPRSSSPTATSSPGVEVDTDLGRWTVHETPGHAPSHVCLYQPERRLLISGDHLLGRVSLYYDYGYTPDPAGEFLTSLDTVEALDARLCLPGHGRTFTDVQAHIEANRALVGERVAATLDVVERARADHGLRRDPARLRRADHAAQRQLVAQRDALLPDPPRARSGASSGSRGTAGEAERWTEA